MRSFFKILLILSAVALVAGGLLYFAMTRLGPPQTMADDNVHVSQVEAAVKNILASPDIDTPNRYFFKASHLIGFLDENELLSLEESDELKAMMVERYAPLLANWCFDRFNAPTWYGEDLAQMNKSISMVKGVRDSDGAAVLQETMEAEGRIAQVKEILDNYKAARQLTRIKSYESMDRSMSQIQKSRSYKADPYLSKNIDLMRELDSVPRRLHDAHWNHLVGRVDHMKNYQWMHSMENVDSLVKRYSDALDEYDESARRIYGYHNSVSELRRQLRDYRKEAHDYYYPPERPSIFSIF